MANTYTQLHVHIVFAVKYRQGLIQRAWRTELYKYMTSIVQAYEHKLLAINGIEDHVHILVGMRPRQALSMLVHEIKQSSALWINRRKLVPCRFAWQEGFGAFSCAKEALPGVIRYIENQEVHHQKQSFMQEYKGMLDRCGIAYDDRYLFKEV